MEYIVNGLIEAMRIIVSLDREFLRIALFSLQVSFASTALAVLLGVPFGVLIAQGRFRGRGALIHALNTLLSLPTVVVGLLCYSFLSRNGPLGAGGLLFSPLAIVIGQCVLALPIVSSLTISAMTALDERARATLKMLGAGRTRAFFLLLHEARAGILAAVIAAFGRVFAEVGVSMMLGGNIKGHTRTITTAIALETGRGEFALGIALGTVLLLVSFTVNFVFVRTMKKNERV